MSTTLNNTDLIRIILWFCGEGETFRVFRKRHRLHNIVFLAQKELPQFEQLQEEGTFTDNEMAFETNNFGVFSKEINKIIEILSEEEEVKTRKEGYLNFFEIQQKLINELGSKYQQLKDNTIFREWVQGINSYGELNSKNLLRAIYENKGFVRDLMYGKGGLYYPFLFMAYSPRHKNAK